MVDAYLGKVANYHLLRLFLAFKEGDAERFEESAGHVLAALDGIETVLSTRPDYSLKRTIDEVTSRPGKGIRPSREQMRLASIAWNPSERTDYLAVEVYEEVLFYYRPRVELYIAEMRRRLQEGNGTALTLTKDGIGCIELGSGFEVVRQEWLKNSLVVDDGRRFCGTTLEAIESVLAKVDARPRP